MRDTVLYRLLGDFEPALLLIKKVVVKLGGYNFSWILTTRDWRVPENGGCGFLWALRYAPSFCDIFCESLFSGTSCLLRVSQFDRLEIVDSTSFYWIRDNTCLSRGPRLSQAHRDRRSRGVDSVCPRYGVQSKILGTVCYPGIPRGYERSPSNKGIWYRTCGEAVEGQAANFHLPGHAS